MYSKSVAATYPLSGKSCTYIRAVYILRYIAMSNFQLLKGIQLTTQLQLYTYYVDTVALMSEL